MGSGVGTGELDALGVLGELGALVDGVVGAVAGAVEAAGSVLGCSGCKFAAIAIHFWLSFSFCSTRMPLA